MVRRRKPRRGVIILVVLSLLVLFVLLGVSFAIVSIQYRRAAIAYSRQEQLGEDPARLADRAMYELLRGTTRTTTPVRGHDLLWDLYGSSVRGQILTQADQQSQNVTPIQQVAGGQFVEFYIYGTSPTNHPRRNGYYNGRVLTFVDGPAARISTRVVRYSATFNQSANQWIHALHVMTPRSDTNAVILPAAGNTFVINGAPFTGTGAGFNAAYDPDAATPTPQNVTALTEEALLPNRIGESNSDMINNYLAGGVNEGYDAADYQNVVLAAVMPQGVIPSFHRPALIHHWMQDAATLSTNTGLSRQQSWGQSPSPVIARAVPANWANSNPAFRDVRGRIVFRPMPWDHPNFTGSNPAFDGQSRSAIEIEQALLGRVWNASLNSWEQANTWDVDNDNDGRPDSIWIDPDFPVQTSPDGRMYKPLIAVLCTDLDGRLNFNAHGTLAHFPHSLRQSVLLAGGSSTDNLPKGQGFGPAEIGLNALINDSTEYNNVLLSRYGDSGVPGDAGHDVLAVNRFYRFPRNFFAPMPTSFFSFFDLRGEFAFGVDHRGQPLSDGIYDLSAASPFPDLLADNAYEFRLVQPDGYNRPFTAQELERVLRHDDVDAAAYRSRLTELVSVLGTDSSARQAATTHSFDLPVPGVLATDDFHAWNAQQLPANRLPQPQSLMDLLAFRVRREVLASPLPPMNAAALDAAVEQIVSTLLSPDLAMGLRMDINRSWGNGRDNNANGIVDEHWHPPFNTSIGINESYNTEPVIYGASNTTLMNIDHDNDGQTANDPDAFLARHYFARHLYVLAMLLKDQGFQYTDDTGTPTAEETARQLAQWAINVVDFRDADSIMTPFEYDVNPFNGWSVDGNIATPDLVNGQPNDERRVVWGCERPELLLSETLAIHDFRTEEVMDPKTLPPPPNDDPHFDQRLSPSGSLFVEIYNPWTGHARRAAEFYSDGANWSDGVLLHKRNAGGFPVWRLAVSPMEAGPPAEPSLVERTVYFAPPNALDPAATAYPQLFGQMHFRRQNIAIAPLLPGRYAVVGTPGETRLGRRMDADPNVPGQMGHAVTRKIVLTPNANHTAHQVDVRNNTTPPATQTDPQVADQPTLPVAANQPVAMQPAIAVGIDRIWDGPGAPALPMRLSISEPLASEANVYPHLRDATLWDAAYADGEGAYHAPYDQPLDWGNRFTTSGDAAQDPESSYRSGTLINHRRIHLQRLANPLAPFDPVTNPYLTIDSLPVDLSRYNAATTDDDPALGDGDVSLSTFERGDETTGVVEPYLRRILWQQPPDPGSIARQNLPDGSGTHILPQVLLHTLGRLNTEYGPAYDSNTAPAADAFAVTSYVGAPDTTSNADLRAFPWLAWNNRPFVSPTELLQVPRSSSVRLLSDFSLLAAAGTYDGEPAAFGHLLNFFDSRARGTTEPGSHLYRLFEYVQTPSPFIDTDTVLNPTIFANASTAGTALRRPPMNRVSQYRDPGRINLNTIYDSRVWQGLWSSHAGPTFDEFVLDRRGYSATAAANPLTLDPNAPYPTFFNKLYRPVGSGVLVPPMGTAGDALIRADVDTTLFRSDSLEPVASLPDTAGTGYGTGVTTADRDVRRNSYFRYQALQRLPNLLTTRSNVYALWITIGYFEVENTAAGQQLGQEVGSDTGEVKRHRAFYIIDRSIPVGFEPDENHNVDRCILLRRFIE